MDAKFYRKFMSIINEEYDDINEFFIPNLKNHRSFFYLLWTKENAPVLLEILKTYSRELIPTFNQESQLSILHCLALYESEFTREMDEIFKIVFSMTYRVTRNKFRRSFLETAIAQKSPNLNFMIENSLIINNQMDLLIIKALKQNTKLRNPLINRVLRFLKTGDLVRPKYQRMYEENRGKILPKII